MCSFPTIVPSSSHSATGSLPKPTTVTRYNDLRYDATGCDAIWLGLASQRSHISMARQPWSAGGRRGAPTSNPQSSWCIWSAIHSSISSIHRQGQTGKAMPGTVRASSWSDVDDQSAIKEKLGGIHMAILCLIAGFDCIQYDSVRP